MPMPAPPAPTPIATPIAFAGTPEFARRALVSLAEAGHRIALVLTQPDRPAGRGLKLQPSPVKQEALQRGLPVLQPRSLRLDGKYPDDAARAHQALANAGVAGLVVAAYGLILPAWTLALPPRGCLNIHASLLPRWRGAAPIQRAIEAGDADTGITLMQMDAGLDTGPMLATRSLAIGADDNAGRLHDRLAELGAALVTDSLPAWLEGRLTAVAQPQDGVTYAAKIDKAEALVDWRAEAALIERRVRAFDPAPGAGFVLDGQLVKLWRARVAAASPAGPPGRVLAAPGLCVACADAAIELLELQPAGGRRIAAAEFLRGRPVAPGTLLG